MIVLKPGISEKLTQMMVTQPTPTAPTLLTATDLGQGDVIRIVWSGGVPFFNVYYRLTSGGPFVLANGTPILNTITQYDVGGLELGTDYTFIVRGINGLGIESGNSNEVA